MKAILSQQKNNIHLQAKAKTVLNRMTLLLIGCVLLIQAQGQADKRLILADQYFAASEYLTAASLYGQFLNSVIKTKSPGDFPLNSKRNTTGKKGAYATNTDILLKQAESYQLANYWKEAAALYNECYLKDSIKYATSLYWYAACQRSMGNYSVAEESVNRFLNQYTLSDSYRSSAINEKETLHFIKSQLARPDSVLYHVQKMNTSFGAEKGFFAPVATDGGYIITSTQSDSVATGTSPYHNRLFHSKLSDGGLQSFEPVAIQSIDASLNQGTASISANGNYLYFTQWKRENGKLSSSIFYSTKLGNGWGAPVLLSSVNQQGHNTKQPFCSVDGRYLFFSSDRTGGMGNFDIWYALLQPDGTTGEPVNLGAVNTTGNEQAPFYHTTTNTLVFASDRTPGMGGYDLFTAKGRETQWEMPENMGYPVNSSRDDIYFFTAGKGALLSNALFSSDRGSECCLATYIVSKTPKRKMMTGIVRECRNNEPVADARVILKDASGKTLETTTTAEGKYSFELTNDVNQRQVFISKEKYNEKSSDMVIEKLNEVNWHTDTLYNAELCIEKKLVIKVENVVTVYFDFDRSQLKDRGITQLDSIYNVLTENSAATVQISGYTDGRGTVEYNKMLSDKRAKACADYLIQKGIDASRISFESFGACCPVEMEAINGRDNPDGRSMNRRALINISKE